MGNFTKSNELYQKYLQLQETCSEIQELEYSNVNGIGKLAQSYYDQGRYT